MKNGRTVGRTATAVPLVATIVALLSAQPAVPTPQSGIGWEPCADYKLLFNASLLGAFERGPIS